MCENSPPIDKLVNGFRRFHDERFAQRDAYFQALVREGRTVVSVLHEIGMALHADELVVMAQGRITHQGACADPATHRALEAVFDHRVAVRELDGQWVALPLPGQTASNEFSNGASNSATT